MNGKNCAVCFALFLIFLSPAYATIYTVSNTNDTGVGSLREAIGLANTNIGWDTIHFNIAGAGLKTISLLSSLPIVQDTLFVDGSSDPGYAGFPLIHINANTASHCLFFSANADYSNVHALNLTGADFAAVQSFADYLKVTACFVGVNNTGTLAQPNDFIGIGIYSSSHVTIGGTTAAEANLISGNGGVSVFFSQSDSSTVLGNKLGTDITGSLSIGNAQGIAINNCSEITIGGNTAAHRNLISGNGIGIQMYESSHNHVYGNYVGTDINGTLAIPNTSNGLYVRGDSNQIGGIIAGQGNVISGNGNGGITLFSGAVLGDSAFGNQIFGNFIGTDASGTLSLPNRMGISIGVGVHRTEIGGTSPAHRNVISGNTTQGIQINFSDSTIIYGNFIGTDVSGTLALGNGTNGVSLSNCDFTYVGNGALAGANIISSNTENGIILSTGNDSTFIQHNYIGTDFSGLQYLPNNLTGIYIRLNNTNSLLGGTHAGEGNFIANNLLRGIEVNSASALNHRILGNSIYGHSNPGIQLSGGNNNQTAPDITGFSGTINTTINGTFTSAPNTTYRLEFFSSPTSAQGKTFLGFSNISTDAAGNYALNETFPVTITAAEPIITATATDPNGNTSAFGVEAVLEVEERQGPLAINKEEIIRFENPLNSHSQIEIRLPSDRFLSVSLLSLEGREVINLYKGRYEKNLPLLLSCEALHEISAGVYLLEISGESIRRTEKVLVN
ncbi:MAG: hypothetical protein AAGD28_05140 [Bacteroidota bacterium]